VAGFWLALFVPTPHKSLSAIWLRVWMNRVYRRRIGWAFAPTFVAAFTSWAALAAAIAACGFHGGNMVVVMRGFFNWTYPDLLHVMGAVSQARMTDLLKHKYFSKRGDVFDLRRTISDLNGLAGRLGASPERGVPAFSLVLLGPMLWSVIEPGPQSVSLRMPAERVQDGSVVVIRDTPVISALMAGEISGETATETALLRSYGQNGNLAHLRAVLSYTFSAATGKASAPAPAVD
jgi:hypothetical protein